MADLLLLLCGAILVNNVVLTQYLGLCPFMGAGGRLETAFWMAALTTFVLTLSAAINYVIYRYLLLPFDLVFLRLIVFIFVIATIVSFSDLLLRKIAPLPHKMLGIFLPLSASNSLILGVALLNGEQANSFIAAIFYSVGAAAGFSLAIVLFAALRERLVMNAVPVPFQGAAISLVTAGLMALAFMGFAGLG
ncbi:MAG: electron transport complex subunit RsxA [Pseudomonadales bacterium]|jgi:electron transport complex protein RnfA|nr:electron transport complex subunit RsxA [Pseudomonadales bacterium]